MVRLTRIYTRGGDQGETSLGSGERVAKHDLRVSAYGTVDEANAVIGCARLHTSGRADDMLERIQHDLFDLGADLCQPEDGPKGTAALRVSMVQVERLEREIDDVNAVALAEDVRLHLRVPAPGLVTEMDACLKELTHSKRGDRHGFLLRLVRRRS